MIYRLLADLTVVAHALFIVFSVLGGLLVLRWWRVAFLHIPCAFWGVYVQVVADGVCPLTPLENHFRTLGHEPGIGPSFIDHYLTSLIYVEAPPPWLHPVLGLTVFAINATVYGILVFRLRRWWLARREAKGIGRIARRLGVEHRPDQADGAPPAPAPPSPEPAPTNPEPALSQHSS